MPEPVEAPEVPATLSQLSKSPAAPSASQSAAQQPQLQAQDIDEIEPEWVQAVRSMLLERVKDPRMLSQSFSELKGQYIRSRFGIEVKSSNVQEKHE